jgi:hypothetical protein
MKSRAVRTSEDQGVLQLDAFARPAPTQSNISDAIVFAQPSFGAALVLACAASGLEDKQIYIPLGIDHAQWSRIKSGQAYFPMRKYDEFAELVGNDILLRYVAHRRRYALVPLQTALEEKVAQLEAENAQLRRENEATVRLAKELLR